MKKIMLTILLPLYAITSFSQEYYNDTVYEARDTVMPDVQKINIYVTLLTATYDQCKYWAEIVNDVITHKKNGENHNEKIVCIAIAQLYFNEFCKSENSSIYYDLIPLYSYLGTSMDRTRLDKCRNNEYSLDDLCDVGTFFELLKSDLSQADRAPGRISESIKPFLNDFHDFLNRCIERSSYELQKFSNKEYPTEIYKKCVCKVPVIYKKLKHNRENYYFNDQFLNSLDVPLQKKGWEWLDCTDEIKEVRTFYPKEDYYEYNVNHPEYKLKLPYVFDKSDNLIFVEKLIRMPRINETYLERLNQLLAKHDFLANKYNVQHDKKEVVIRIKKDLGLLPEGNEGFRNIMAISSRNFKTKLRGYVYLMSSFSIQEDAEKFTNQCKSDHQDDLEYVYEIKRLDNTSFLIKYLNSKGESSITVKIHYLKKNGNASVDFKLELLPTEKKQIVKIREIEPDDWNLN